jgi:hypothetical protein
LQQWLDEGAGRKVDLESCPRHRLESECINYLNSEQREVYRVVVDKPTGLLVWAKDGSPLDTSKYHADRGPENGGIVEISKEEYDEIQARKKKQLEEKKANGGESPSSSSSSSSSDTDEEDQVREGTRPYGGDKVRFPLFLPQLSLSFLPVLLPRALLCSFLPSVSDICPPPIADLLPPRTGRHRRSRKRHFPTQAASQILHFPSRRYGHDASWDS